MKHLWVLGLLLLTACGSPAKVEDYAGRTPKLDMRQYLKGEVEAWGVFKDRNGMVTKQFYCLLKGTWNGNDGTLDEQFKYNDGTTSSRVWKVHFTNDTNFTATAHDVIGTAHGSQAGNAINMQYVLRVPVDDTTYDVDMNDWMYRVSDDTVLNHTVMKKFGVKVGELVLTFRKKKT